MAKAATQPQIDQFAPLSDDEKRNAAQLPSSSPVEDDNWQVTPLSPAKFPGLNNVHHQDLGTPDACFAYRNGPDVLFYILRWEVEVSEEQRTKEVRPYAFGTWTIRSTDERNPGAAKTRQGWRFKFPPAPLPLYNLSDIEAKAGAPVLVCEGEKTAETAAHLLPNFACTTSCGGSQRAHKTDWSVMRSRHVTIWPDNDEPGCKYAEDVATLCRKAGASYVAVVSLPSHWPRGWDLADKLPEGESPDAVIQLIRQAQPSSSPDGGERNASKSIEASPTGPRDGPHGNALISAALQDLTVDRDNLPRTAANLADRLRSVAELFDRGGPVEIVRGASTGVLIAAPLDVNGIVRHCHRVCQPVEIGQGKNGPERCQVTLPDRVAKIYLSDPGGWKLRPLNGFTSGVLQKPGGGILSEPGYDIDSGLLLTGNVRIDVPEAPTEDQALAALQQLRERFRTFPFLGSTTVNLPGSATPMVNVEVAPGSGESAFLAALMTAVCRPALPLAPAVLFRAPSYSGSGAGKGLLARCVSLVAFGEEPSAITSGFGRDELEKRIGAVLMSGSPVLFLDNVNATTLRSDTLASVTTEAPATVRPLGSSNLVRLNSKALVLVTGNGVTLGEDLVRRFVTVDIDPGIEVPSSRLFTGDLLAEVRAARGEILSQALTVWRWGQQMSDRLPAGRPMGSYAVWARWCRDPLLALGCRDVAECVIEAIAQDPSRAVISELLEVWYRLHGSRQVALAELAEPVRAVLDQVTRSRQDAARYLINLHDTRCGGYVLRKVPRSRGGGSNRFFVEPTSAATRSIGTGNIPASPSQEAAGSAPSLLRRKLSVVRGGAMSTEIEEASIEDI